MGLSVTMSLQADLRGSHPTNVVNGAPEFGSRERPKHPDRLPPVQAGNGQHGTRTQPNCQGGIVLDHIYISVSDVPRSVAFYAAALQPLGWRELGSYDSSTGPADVPDLYGLADEAYGSGVAVGSSIWLRRRQPGETGLYVGFVADNETEVNAAYAAAIEAGGTSEGEPAIRTYFGPNYYAANIGDFDDNHLEIVHKTFNPPSRPHPQ